MATVNCHTSQDGKKTYRARVKVKGYPLQSKTFTTRTSAKRWAQALEVKLREAPHLSEIEARKHTLSETIERYKESVLPGKSASSQKDQGHQLDWWTEHYGDRTLAAVNPSMLVEARDKLGKEPIPSRAKKPDPEAPPRYRSRTTCNLYMAAISHLLTVATNEWQWMTNNPAGKVRPLKTNNARTRYLSEGPGGELERLLEACRISESEDLYTAVLMALTTGARKMEIMGIHWRDINLDAATLTFRKTKNQTPRTVAMPAAAVELLRERKRTRQRLDTPLVFPGRAGPTDQAKPIKPIDLAQPWQTALRRAEIDDFRFHDLRHSAASYLAMSGATLNEIAAVLGHKSLHMVQRYAHLSSEHVATVSAKIGERVLGGNGNG